MLIQNTFIVSVHFPATIAGKFALSTNYGIVIIDTYINTGGLLYWGM